MWHQVLGANVFCSSGAVIETETQLFLSTKFLNVLFRLPLYFLFRGICTGPDWDEKGSDLASHLV